MPRYNDSMSTKILICIDFSPLTPRIVKTGKELAKALNLGVHLVHAQPEKPSAPTAVVHQGADPSLGREMMKEIKELNNLKSDFEEEDIPCSYATPRGKTSDVIAAEAAKVEAPYIVLGSHGNGAMYHLVVGSVAEGVMKKLDTPVILVPAQQRLDREAGR